MDSILGPGLRLHIDSTLEHFDYREIELLGELPVAGVVGRNGHDGAGSVGYEHIVGDPYRNPLAIDWVDGIAAAEYSGLVLGQVGSFQIRFTGGLLDIGLDSVSLGFGSKFLHQGMFWRYDHIGGAEQSVASGGIDFEAFRAVLEFENHAGPFAPANPVALHRLDGVRPIQTVQVFQ